MDSQKVLVVGGPADGAIWNVITERPQHDTTPTRGRKFLPVELFYITRDIPAVESANGYQAVLSDSGDYHNANQVNHRYRLEHVGRTDLGFDGYLNQMSFGERTRSTRESGLIGETYPVYVWQNNDGSEEDNDEWVLSNYAMLPKGTVGQEVRRKAINDIFERARFLWTNR
ncbi:hypothetical protein SEA_CHEWYVIII_8 [Rhodococcus phage ChewyVIII]|uniref:Uncharacterized protein n=1 Tax=Rhodococcus phage ChewyVIII TaxID=1887657 RepID=A0A1C9EI24_9CAUD|nr:hypothetical protein QEH30_gp08 [Rhodococcus phage ChewyVIII]AON97431.1 hypothetical protein SEA_CHEWYVIII_8 [Rhodococcus phage ChewyVIII]